MNIYDRVEFNLKNFKRTISTINEIKLLEIEMNSLIEKRRRLATKTQIVTTFNLLVTAVAIMLPDVIKMILILSSLSLTAYKVFRAMKQIESLDKMINNASALVEDKVKNINNLIKTKIIYQRQ